MRTRVKNKQEIAAMREAGRMLATVLQVVKAAAAPGVSTKELDDIAARELKALGGKPSFLGYNGFPNVLCVSVDEEVVHGIPRADKLIAAGDIVSLDFGVTYQGMVTDSALSLIVGKPKSEAHAKLVEQTEVSLEAGIAVLHDQVRAGDIGAAVQAVLDRGKYGIVRDLVGHGVGHELHEDPNIPNYGRAHTGPWLEAGMTIAIEPMATLGTDRVFVAPDGWTICTQDGSWAAHFEHTVLITKDGAEILTKV
jgi:methionyl aminopeptidase